MKHIKFKPENTKPNQIRTSLQSKVGMRFIFFILLLLLLYIFRLIRLIYPDAALVCFRNLLHNVDISFFFFHSIRQSLFALCLLSWWWSSLVVPLNEYIALLDQGRNSPMKTKCNYYYLLPDFVCILFLS